jgi:hypothetical protein
MRDGLRLWYKGKPPTYIQAHQPQLDPAQRALMVDILLNIFARRYFEYGNIESLTQFFKVSKGEFDI